jgi:hypothetical protein
MILSNKESKIKQEDLLTQVRVVSDPDTSKTIWIKTKYADINNILKLEGDSTEWAITDVYSNSTKEAKFITPGDIWDTQPIQRGNK